MVPFLHFNLCSSLCHQESSRARQRELFLPGLYCSCPTFFPGGFEALLLLLQESQHFWFQTFLFSLAASPITMMKAVLASHLNFQRFCHSAVASQHRKFTIPRAEEIGREKSPSITWVTKVCVRNPPTESLHGTRADIHEKKLPEGLC